MKTLDGLLRATHLGPTLAVTALAGLLAVAFGLTWSSSVLVVVAVFLNQVSVGISNDALDVHRDRDAKRSDKPLVRGDVSLGVAWSVAGGALVGSLVLSLLINPLVAVWQAVFLAAGWAYNAGLKSTLWSGACYAIGFGALPILVSFAAPTPQFPAWWVVIVAAGLGLSAHFANVLPDLHTDHLHGVAGLPQRLGPRFVPVVVVGLTLVSGIVLVVGVGSPGFGVTLPTAVVALGLAVVAALLAQKPHQTALPFQLSMTAALVMALGLALGSGV